MDNSQTSRKRCSNEDMFTTEADTLNDQEQMITSNQKIYCSENMMDNALAINPTHVEIKRPNIKDKDRNSDRPGKCCLGIYEYGNCYAMCFDKNGDPWITIGPDFPFTLCMFVFVWGMHAVFLFFLFQIKTEWTMIKYIGVMLSIIQSSSMLLTVFLNPGHPKKVKGLPRNLDWCKKCNGPKLRCYETYHCDDCGKCVEWYDHHCPWMSKCIGKNTIIPFYVFIGSFLIMIFAVFFVVALYLEQNKPERSRKLL